MEKCLQITVDMYISVNLIAIVRRGLENMLNNILFFLEMFGGTKIGCTFVSVFMVKDFKVVKTSCREDKCFYVFRFMLRY